MSYASIASHNAPTENMPQPDQNLADGHFAGETQAHADVDSKINVLPAGTDVEHPPVPHHEPHHPAPIHLHSAAEDVPAPHVSEAAPKPLPTPHKHDISIPESGASYEAKAKKNAEKAEKKLDEGADKAEKKGKEVGDKAEKKGKQLAEDAGELGDKVEKKGHELAKEAGKLGDKAEKKGKQLAEKANELSEEAGKKGKELGKKAKAELQEVENSLGPYWEKTKDIVLRPGTLGGLMGLVNVGILGTAGYFAYTRRNQPWDRRIVGGAVASTLALFSAEGYVADSYLNTPEGQQEAERAKREGSHLYMEARERLLRPEVAGGLLGAVNVAIVGAVGYVSYKNWNKIWDPRIVVGVAAGLVGLSGLEGYAGKAYADKTSKRY